MLQGGGIDRFLANHDELPVELFRCENLVELEISFTKIKVIQDGIRNLQNLEALSLRSNQLISINKEISKLTKLKYLGLHNNMLQEIPVEFNCLNLTRLNLSNNYIKEFKNFKDIPLKELLLSNNQLSEFPNIHCSIVKVSRKIY